MATNTNILGLTKPAYNDDADVSVINANMDLIDAESGRLRGNFAGTYDATASYAVGAYCIYQGNLYRCTTAIGSGGEAWTAEHWTQVAVGDELAKHLSQFGSMTIAGMQTAIESKLSNLVDGESFTFKVSLTDTSSVIAVTGAYTGIATRSASTRVNVILQESGQTAHRNYMGTLTSNGWQWGEIAWNSDLAKIGQPSAASTTYNSLDNFKAGLISIVSGMNNGEVRKIRFGFSVTSVAPFKGYTWSCEITRGSASYFSGIAYTYGTDVNAVEIKYSNGTWSIEELAKKSSVPTTVSGSAALGSDIVISRGTINHAALIVGARNGIGFAVYVCNGLNESVILSNVNSAVTNVAVSYGNITITLKSSGSGSSIDYTATIW